jgi:hypothetical protein
MYSLVAEQCYDPAFVCLLFVVVCRWFHKKEEVSCGWSWGLH